MANVTIQSYQITNYQGGGSTAELRLYASKSWTDLAQVRHVRGSVDSDDSYQSVTCSIAGTVITIPEFTTQTTDDAVDANDVLITFAVYIDGKYYTSILRRVAISTEIPSPMDIEDIRLYNGQTIHKTVSESFEQRVMAYLATLQLAPLAGALTHGRTRLSLAPDNVAEPIAVGTNDVRVKDNIFNYGNDLQTAMTALTGIECVLVVNAPIAVATSKNIPSNICVEFGSRGKFTPAAGATITVNKMLDAGNRQVFDVAASNSKIIFGVNAVQRINIGWLCGFANGADATKAINLALESCTNNEGGCVFIPESQYISSGGHIVPYATSIEGMNDFITIGNGGSAIVLTNETEDYLFKIEETTYDTAFSRMTLDGGVVSTAIGILMEGDATLPNASSGKCVIERVTFSRLNYGINFNSLSGSPDNTWQMAQVSVKDCRFQACDTGVRQDSVNASFTFINCTFYIPTNGWAMDAVNGGSTSFLSCEFAGAGTNDGCVRCSGAHGSFNFFSCQEEGTSVFIHNTASDTSGIFNLHGNLIQSKIQLDASCVVNSYGNNYLSKVFKFGGVGTECRIISEGDHIQARDVADGVTVVNPPVLTEGGLNNVQIYKQNNTIEGYGTTRFRQRIISTILQQALTTPMLELGVVHDGASAYNRPMLRFSKLQDNNEASQHYYDVYRSDTTGWLTFVGSQADPFRGFSFNAPIRTTDYAYDASWNGALEVPTMNAVYDEVEVVRSLANTKLNSSKVVKGTVTVNPASLGAGLTATETVALVGAAVGDTLILNVPAAGLTANLLVLQYWVSAADQIKIVFYNFSGGVIDEPSASWNYTLIKP